MTEQPRSTTFSGTWHAFTETGSHYEVDLDSMTVKRNAGSTKLRRDGEEVHLWAVDELRIGLPAEMWVEVRADGLLTFRRTSVVTALVPADETCRLGVLDRDVAPRRESPHIGDEEVGRD